MISLLGYPVAFGGTWCCPYQVSPNGTYGPSLTTVPCCSSPQVDQQHLERLCGWLGEQGFR